MKLPYTILLVEDDSDDQDLFISALREIKNAPLFDIVRNGKEAIEKLRRSLLAPSMIFMDINMPVMDGMECLSELAKDPRMSCIPVVMLSSDVQQKQKALQLGAIEFIKKPNSTFILREELEHVLSKITTCSVEKNEVEFG